MGKLYLVGDISDCSNTDTVLDILCSQEATNKFTEHIIDSENSGYDLVYTNSLTPYKKLMKKDSSTSSGVGWLHEILEKEGGGSFIGRKTKVAKKEYEFYFGESAGGRTVAVGKIFFQSGISQAEENLRELT